MKANPWRGEAEFGDHKLVVDFNGWCIAEAATGLKTQELLRLMDEERLSFLELRAVVRSFLSSDLTSEQVGDLIGEVGLEGTAKALAKAMEGFFPASKDRSENPPAAA